MNRHRDEALREVAKRLFDLVVALAGLAALVPVFLVVAVAVKLDSPGPVFFRGERVGRRGRPFRIFKFRSMRVSDVGYVGGPDTTSDTDERLTRVGKVLRHFKLDELPQLIDVALGRMSLVGPRPEVPWCVALYSEDERTILGLRPGLTDWASIRFHDEGAIVARSGYCDADVAYLELIRPEKIRLQLRYVREQSMAVDLRILWLTLATLLQTRFFQKNGPILPADDARDTGYLEGTP